MADLFADIIVPLALPQTLTYRVPEEFAPVAECGQRVIVPVGTRLYTGIIWRLHDREPQGFKVKALYDLLDRQPIVQPQQLQFWEIMARYYLCTMGEIMKAALPAGLKLESETHYALSVDEIPEAELDDDEYLLLEAMQNNGEITLEDGQKILQRKSVVRVFKKLIERGWVEDRQEIEKRYKPKQVRIIELHPDMQNDTRLREVMDGLGRAKKQSDVLLAFLHHSGYYTGGPGKVNATVLLSAVDGASAALKALVKKEIFTETLQQESRLKFGSKDRREKPELSAAQAQALAETEKGFAENKPVLLQGVTGSGKTEIYIRLIEKALAEGKQVLYLLPEIALTMHLIERVKEHFPGQVAVYHSRFGQNERVEVWNNFLQNGSYKIVLGARSALFLPYHDLGLIIVDEEHDASYKQQDPAPRYQARDFALVLAARYQAQVILGSATPSLESYYNTQNGKYRLVELKERYSRVQLPEIVLENIREAQRKKEMYSLFSKNLLENIKERLKNKEQVILFQNRRGFSARMECEDCGNVPYCPHCDVALTYHKSKNELKCHLCGYMTPLLTQCPACKSPKITLKGFGTEKVEDELQIFLPDARIARLDWDVATRKNAYHQILAAFEAREINILVGTQMITKGLDFDHVGLVGVLNADSLLHFPDFRSNERAFQLLTQVAGRAGRREKPGRVIIQTAQPENAILQFVLAHDYTGFYKHELEERRSLHYPPFYRIMRIVLRHKDEATVQSLAGNLAALMGPVFGNRVLGPESPHIARVRNLHIRHIYLKISNEESQARAKEVLARLVNRLQTESGIRNFRIDVDVDTQ
ncbi:MAG: primosomal protein N' [Bacteroidia bacterium]|nr:primosomal protein N' [Bacteroidia bacterium]